MDLLCFCSVLCLLCLCARLFICALWSPAEKGLTSWLSFVVSAVSCQFPIGILGQVWYLIVSIPDLCSLTYFVLHVRLRCGSLSITTPVSLLANEFDVRSVLHGLVSLTAINQILCKFMRLNLKIHYRIASKM